MDTDRKIACGFGSAIRLYAITALLTGGIFFLDLLGPLGLAEWLLYFLPLLVVSRAPRPLPPLIVAAAATVLIAAGFVLDSHPALLESRLSAVNRTLGAAALWVTAIVLAQRRQAYEALRQARENLEERVRERTGTLVEEIAERERAKAALQESEERFRRLFDLSPLGKALVSPDFRFLRVNEAFCRITGYSAGEMASLDFPSITHPEDLAADVEQARRLLAGETDQYEMEKRYIRKDGSIVWVRLHTRGIRDEGGRFLYFLPVVEDITERKRAEAERERLLVQIEQEREKLQTLVESIGDEVWFIDKDRNLLLLNPSSVQGLGLEGAGHRTLDEALSELEIVTPDGSPRPREKAPLYRALAGEICRGEEFARHCGTGEMRYRRYHAAPVRDRTSGRILGAVAVVSDITEHRKMEEALRRSHEELEERVRERTRELFDLTEDLREEVRQRRDAEEAARREQIFRETIEDSLVTGLVAVDHEGRILSVNDAFCAMTGWSREELLGTGPPYRFWPPEEIETIRATAWKTLGKGSPLADQEFVLLRRSGERFPVLVYASPFRDPEGTPKGYVVSVSDITERKKAETEYRTILKTAMDGFWISDHEGRFLDVNDAACRHFGYTREELLGGMRIPDIEAAESPEETAARIRKIREEGQDRFETRHRHKDGRIVDTEVSVNYLDIGGGRFFVFIRDITERKKAEEALRRLYADLERKVRERTAELQSSNERLRETQRQQRALLDAIPDIAWLKDREGRLIAVNQSYGQACGIDPADLIGKTDLDAWPRELAEKYMADDRRVVESGRMTRLEEPTLGRGGEEAWVDTFKVPIFSEGGEVIGTVGIARDITQRKRAEEALQESEAKYRALAEEFRALLDAIPDMVYFKDTGGRHRFVNRAFEGIMGTSQDEVVGKTYEDLMPPELAESCRRSDNAVYEARDVVRSEEEMPGPGGTSISLETIKAPLFDERGGIAGLVGLTRDITQRKRIEAELSAYRGRLEAMVEERTAALVEAEERFHLFFDRLIAGAALHEIVCDESGTPVDYRFLEVNPAFEALTGLAAKAVIGKTVKEAIPEIEPFWIEVYGKVALTGEPIHFQRISEALNRHYEVIAFSPKRGQFATTFVDITERKKAEAALKESEERFRSLVEHSLVGFFLVQEDRVVFMNPAQERIFGSVRVPFPYAELEESVLAEDVGKFRESREALRAGRVAGREAEIRLCPKGAGPGKRTFRWVHSRMAPVTYRGKDAVLINMVDITQLREMERIALIQEKMASLGHVAAGVAHEIRNPLSGLNIHLSALERTLEEVEGLEPEVQETTKTILKMAASASGKIEGVVRRVMDLANPAPPKMVPVSVNACMRETLHLAMVTLRKAGVRLTETLSTGLPKVMGDACLLERVLLNLLTNAVQEMEGQEKEKRIEVSSALESGHVTVSVSDSGPGVSEEIREKIFDPFFTTKKEGTGIGLSLSHRIVSDHGGFIRVGTSRFGGALFTIGLPAGDKGEI
jgi:PAS domain S-box-containing protein